MFWYHSGISTAWRGALEGTWNGKYTCAKVFGLTWQFSSTIKISCFWMLPPLSIHVRENQWELLIHDNPLSNRIMIFPSCYRIIHSGLNGCVIFLNLVEELQCVWAGKASDQLNHYFPILIFFSFCVCVGVHVHSNTKSRASLPITTTVFCCHGISDG